MICKQSIETLSWARYSRLNRNSQLKVENGRIGRKLESKSQTLSRKLPFANNTFATDQTKSFELDFLYVIKLAMQIEKCIEIESIGNSIFNSKFQITKNIDIDTLCKCLMQKILQIIFSKIFVFLYFQINKYENAFFHFFFDIFWFRKSK